MKIQEKIEKLGWKISVCYPVTGKKYFASKGVKTTSATSLRELYRKVKYNL